ncbi:MAG: hypothetical protein H6R10_2804 [Rhodocyclaceae bacterium]|nr:hypothetical protein [Rhodocyclaceae bacterium]
MKRQKATTQPPREEIMALNNMREWAYLRGQNLVRDLFSTIQKFKVMPSPVNSHHQAEFEVARGFVDGLNIVLDDSRKLVPQEYRRHFLPYLQDDLVDNVDKGLRVMGDGWVSPWIVHADKLQAPGQNARRLQNLTIGLYRQFQPFDAGRCLTGLDEEYRVIAIEMLESFSKLGRHDRAFMDAAETLIKGEEP